ncbi:MAG: AsmA family protein [Hyphomicrobiaceae bacterium]
MRYAVYGLIGLVCAALAAGVFIFIAAPTGYVRDRLIAEVKQRTGRDLVVAGGATFTVYPRLGVDLKNVSLSGPPGMERETFIKMERLRVAIPLLPLMRREVAIDELVLVHPIIQLAVDEQGRRTWDFTRPQGAVSREVAPTIESAEGSAGASDAPSLEVTDSDAAPATSDRASRLTDTLAGLSLGDVRIEHGEVRYANLQTRSRERFTEVDVKLTLTSIDAPFEVSGSLNWNKRALPLTARLSTLKSFLDESGARLELKLDAAHVSASYDGKLDIAGVALLDGKVALNTGSLRDLAEWTGARLPPVGGLGPLDLAAHLTVAGPRVGLTDARLVLDGAKATGILAFESSGKRPALQGSISIDKLDLNTYLAEAPASGQIAKRSKSQTGTSKDESTAVAPEAQAGVDETASPPPSDKPAKRKPSKPGWSTERIDVAGLKALDADLTISAGALFYQDIKIGKSRVILSLADGLLKARLPELLAYGGKGLGTILIDGRRPVPAITGNVTINGVKALPMLSDAMALDWIEGEGSISLGFTSRGQTEKALVQALKGQGRFAFTNGAIVGVNIPQMVRGLGQGKVGGLDRNDAMKTDFSELSGTLSIVNGIVTNKDLNLVGPLIRIAGAGTIDMPAQSLDYAAMPKIVASLEGQGAGDATGFTIPVKIRGPWSKPRIAPDLGALAKNPEAVAETVKQLGTKLKGADKDKVKQALEKLSGSKGGSKVEDLIGGVLGQ